MRGLCVLSVLLLLYSCTSYRKVQDVRSGRVTMGLAVPQDSGPREDEEEDEVTGVEMASVEDGPIIMNAIRDSQTGEMVAMDIISASKVVARFRNVAERGGVVSLGFDLTVPGTMLDSHFKLRINPFMTMFSDTVSLDAVHISGRKYREAQMRGYERYRAFVASIITDSTDFIRKRLLDVFICRNFPEIHAMKDDSSFVSDRVAESVFGVARQEVVRHYTDHLRLAANQRRKSRTGQMFGKYVKDPLTGEGVRLDTVLCSSSGGFTYRYVHSFASTPGLRKVCVSLCGSLSDERGFVADVPFDEKLTYYISSLSTLADTATRYRTVILERVKYDNTKALIDFAQGSHEVDTLLGDNASELARVRRCVRDVEKRDEYELDSLVITASCSPEGEYGRNLRLSRERAAAVRDVMGAFVPDSWKDRIRVRGLPENWSRLGVIVENDRSLPESVRGRVAESVMVAETAPDDAERALRMLPEYRYLREKVYPKLRSVAFDFHLHRKDVVKDTVHTEQVDSVYMSGVKALRNLDYRKAVALLRPYRDFNSALAFMSAGYNHSALDVLEGLSDRRAKVCYLKAVLLARFSLKEDALKYLRAAIELDPSLRHRANLDPELSFCGELL